MLTSLNILCCNAVQFISDQTTFNVFAMALFATLTFISYQYVSYRTFWIGFWDTMPWVWGRVCGEFWFHRNFKKQTFMARDGEKYAVWTLKDAVHNIHDKRDHIWICLPAGCQPIDTVFDVLVSKQTFKGSRICMFNNPGISTKMKSKPLPSPTETTYLIEFIEKIQRKNGYRVSLIGFSIGSVQALRTLHEITNNPSTQNRIQLESLVFVHGPDCLRDAVEHFKHNWFIRMDLFFAILLRWLQHRSGSWKMIKHLMNLNVFDGWSFIQRASEISFGKTWDKVEGEMFDIRTFCDKSIQESTTKVYRMISRNDWIVLFESIDTKYHKYFDEVFISNRGGHCGITQCADSVDKIQSWNDQIVLEM